MAFLRFVAWLTARRARASWRMMAASAIGVLLAVTMASVAAIHSRTLAEAGLRYTLGLATSLEERSFQVVAQDRPLGRQDYESLRRTVEDAIQTRLGGLPDGMHYSGHSQSFPYVRRSDDTPPARGAPTAYIFFQRGFQEHSRLLSGRWPQGPDSTSDEGHLSLEVALGVQAAQDLGWTPDATLFLVPFGTAPEEKVAITVVGIVEPADPEDLYWFNDLSKFLLGDEVLVAPLYAGEEGFFEGVGARYPMLLGTYWWYVFLDVESLTADTAPGARRSLVALEADINRSFPRSLVLSAFGGVIAGYQRDLALARVPLFLFTSLVIGVVLYYLVLITVILARDRGGEAAMIRSRGATVSQVGALLGLGEGFAIALPAVLVGPFLGWAIASVLPTGDPGLGHSAGLSPSVFAVAAVAGLVCVVVFLASGMGVAGRGIVHFLRERGRPPERPAIYRYAIDLVALAALGLVWWQIRGRGGFLTQRLLGEGLEVDPSLLLGPALALLAVGLLMLRLLPLLLRLLARLADPFSVPWLVHALRRMARDHFAYGPLAVLLMLATALGTFGATFGATLVRSGADQARYAIGGEVVVTPSQLNFGQSVDEMRKEMSRVPGVRNVVQIYRGNLAYGRTRLSLLAVDPANLPDVAWFRNDLADKDMEELLTPLLQPLPADRAVPLPAGTERVGIWVSVDKPYSSYNLYLRLRDAVGRYESVLLDHLGFYSWAYLDAPMPEGPRLQPPFTLVGITISGIPSSGFGSGRIALDDVTVMVEGELEVVEGFESVGPWTVLPNTGVEQVTLTYDQEAAHSGRAGGLYAWTKPISGRTQGLVVPPVPMPIPAIGSASFGPDQELVGRFGSHPLGLVVRDTAEHFPTLYSEFGPFLIVNLEHLDRYLRILPLAKPLEPTEFWIGLQEGVDMTRTIEALREVLPPYTAVRDREEMAARAEGNPMAGGAWQGLALLAAATLGGVATLGFGLYAGLAVKRARLELGVLRAIGLSRWRVGMMLALEGLVVAVVGLGVGAVMGGWVGRWALGYLDITARGRPLVPPIDLAMDGGVVALAYAEVTMAAVVAILLALVLATRLRLHEVLRVEE